MVESLSVVGASVTQTQPVPGRDDQVQNNAGGFVFSIGPWGMLDRFLVLGSEGGTYYATERKLTKDNIKNIVALVKSDGVAVVQRVTEISESGRAPKNDQALYVLALAACSEDPKTRKAALEALPKVARIGTHLFHFVSFVNDQRGWGRSLRRAVSNWYLGAENDKLAYQLIKYQSRDGWSHADVLRLAHPKPTDSVKDALFGWVKDPKSLGSKEAFLPAQVQAFEAAKRATSASEIVKLIRDFDLPRECIPTNFLTDVTVWEALAEKMPMTATIRNLATMTTVGLLTPGSIAARKIADQITNQNSLRRARVHPITLLSALMTYQRGHGVRGGKTWTPVREVVDALDSAFYLAFGNVHPTGKNILIGLDVSGSMGSGEIAGVPGLTPRDASAALALVTASVEPNFDVVGFTSGGRWSSRSNTGLTVLDIRKGMKINQVISKISSLPFGGTDASLPVKHAINNKLDVDAFITITDNETYGGQGHVYSTLNDYRNKRVAGARSIVIGMTATDFTINDPKDCYGLDVVGFDSASPQIISDFIRG